MAASSSRLTFSISVTQWKESDQSLGLRRLTGSDRDMCPSLNLFLGSGID